MAEKKIEQWLKLKAQDLPECELELPKGLQTASGHKGKYKRSMRFSMKIASMICIILLGSFVTLFTVNADIREAIISVFKVGDSNELDKSDEVMADDAYIEYLGSESISDNLTLHKLRTDPNVWLIKNVFQYHDYENDNLFYSTFKTGAEPGILQMEPSIVNTTIQLRGEEAALNFAYFYYDGIITFYNMNAFNFTEETKVGEIVNNLDWIITYPRIPYGKHLVMIPVLYNIHTQEFKDIFEHIEIVGAANIVSVQFNDDLSQAIIIQEELREGTSDKGNLKYYTEAVIYYVDLSNNTYKSLEADTSINPSEYDENGQPAYRSYYFNENGQLLMEESNYETDYYAVYAIDPQTMSIIEKVESPRTNWWEIDSENNLRTLVIGNYALEGNDTTQELTLIDMRTGEHSLIENFDYAITTTDHIIDYNNSCTKLMIQYRNYYSKSEGDSINLYVLDMETKEMLLIESAYTFESAFDNVYWYNDDCIVIEANSIASVKSESYGTTTYGVTTMDGELDYSIAYDMGEIYYYIFEFN